MAEYILEIKNLKKYYGKSRGIENVTIKLEKFGNVKFDK